VLPTKLETVDNIVDYVIKKKNDKWYI
jgi:hypothetical protein